MLVFVLSILLLFDWIECFSPRKSSISRITSTTLFGEDSTKLYSNHHGISQSGNRLMIFGLGNVGKLVAQKSCSLRFQGAPFFDHVYGTIRNTMNITGVQVIDFGSYKELKEILPSCTHILVTIPPTDPSFDSDTNTTFARGTAREKYFCDTVLNHSGSCLQDLIPANTWVGYISSTSVYGNHNGKWVTEESEAKCSPGTKGELYYRAESEWRNESKECGWTLHVFRASGLYSNQRSALHTIRKKVLVEKSDEALSKVGFPTSRVHEEDVCRAILSAMMCNGTTAGEACLWNLADDNPAPRSEVMAFGTKLLEEANLLPRKISGVKPQKKVQQTERESRRKTDRKRVDNHKIKELLLPDGKLLYPTYHGGLKSVLGANKEEWSM